MHQLLLNHCGVIKQGILPRVTCLVASEFVLGTKKGKQQAVAMLVF